MRLLALALCLVFSSHVFAADTLDARRKQLNDLVSEYWEHSLKVDPVFASIIGDKRYNDQLGSESAEFLKKEAASDREYLARFEAIDTTGFPQQEKLNKELEIREIKRGLGSYELKMWQMPVSQISGIHIQAPQLVTILSFATVKDYTDYISRLHQLPRVFDETMDNMRLGMADGMMPPKFLLEKAVDQTNEIANAPIEKSPFAQPFDKFPASFSDADKTRLKKDGLDAIQHDVVPAYVKLAKFLKDDYAPKGRTEVGIWSLPNGDAIYRFMVRESTTTDVEPEKIHEIGLQQVAEIEKQQSSHCQ